MKKKSKKAAPKKPLNKGDVKRCLRVLKLREGEKLNRNPENPVIHINGKGKLCYLWIGNDKGENAFCYATFSGTKTLKKFAESLLSALDGK